MAGRPTKFTQELSDQICERIATSSDGLRKICKELGLSTYSVVKWLSEEDKKEFTIQYARAKEQQADLLAEEIIQIADEVTEYTEHTEVMGGEGSYTSATTKDNHARARLMIDSRKWLAAKLAPKKYGDKMEVDLTNKVIQVLVDPEQENEGL